jgi:hypothetical protein
MSKWAKVGEWLKDNAGAGTALVGSLITGNVPAAIAAGVSLVSSATGSDSPDIALAQLQGSPESVLKLRELYYQNESSVRQHIETMARLELEDGQLEHSETQTTIRAGDASLDDRIRLVRPSIAKESWIGTVAYCLGCFGVRAMTGTDIFDAFIAGFLSAPAWAYLGLRTGDKLVAAWRDRAKK